MLHTDASRLKGLGYDLLQQHGKEWRLVQCGSCCLSEVETRYVTVELELVAVVWTLRKCRTYFLGLPHFSLVIEHKPLVSILNDYTLDAVENPQLQRRGARDNTLPFLTQFLVHQSKIQNHLIWRLKVMLRTTFVNVWWRRL